MTLIEKEMILKEIEKFSYKEYEQSVELVHLDDIKKTLDLVITQTCCGKCSWRIDTTKDEQDLGIYCYLTLNSVDNDKSSCNEFTTDEVDFETERKVNETPVN